MNSEEHVEHRETEWNRYASRRRLLAWSGTVVLGGLAGCVGDEGNNSGSPTASSTPSGGTVFEEIRFEGPELVVELRPNHDVSRINLIDPNGSLYTQTDVAKGASIGRLQILDIQAGLGDYEHYAPGTYELTAIKEDSTQTRSLEMRPSLRLTAASQYKPEVNRGNLSFKIENIGTAPTWPYQIVYDNAPNDAANSELNERKGIPQFLEPEDPIECIIPPGESADFVGNTPPAVLTDDGSSDQVCNGQTVELSAIIGTVVGPSLEQTIELTLSGDRSTVGTSDSYTCSEIKTEVISGDGLDA